MAVVLSETGSDVIARAIPFDAACPSASGMSLAVDTNIPTQWRHEPQVWIDLFYMLTDALEP